MANLATINGNILGDSGIDSIDLIVGTGTVNYIPKFTAEGNIGNSLLVDNGSILSYNGSTVLNASNYNSYSPTLTGSGASGTWGISITGGVNTTGDFAIVNTSSGTGLNWFGRTGLRNAAADRSVFLGVYNGNAIVGAHNHALNAWADLYVNNANGVSGANVYLPSTTFIANNVVLHAANYTDYTVTKTGSGASGTWGINVTGTANSETLATVTGRGSSTSSTLNLNGRVNIGNGLSRPNYLNSDAVAHARIGGADVHLYVASLEAASGYRVGVQAARASDFQSFGLDLQSNGGMLLYGGIEVVRNSGTWGINVTGTSGSISGFNNPTTAATPNTIAYRDASGDISVRELVLNVAVQNFTPSSLVAIYPTTNQAVKVTASGAREFLSVPTRTGGDASGIWSIKVRGTDNAYTSALLQSGTGRGDDASGDTWLFADSLGSDGNKWGIKHNQLSNLIEFWGNNSRSSYIDLANGNYYSQGNFYATASGHLVLHTGNYNSYALPLSGGSVSGTITMSVGGAGNILYYTGSGVAAPTFSSRSNGTKIVLYPELGGSSVDYAIGIEGNTMWYSVPVAGAARFFRWYGGTTNIATMDSAGLFTSNYGVTILRDLGTNDYGNVAQHNLQLRIRKASMDGGCGPRTLELGVLDNGTAIIQANQCGVGYNTLSLNPQAGAVLINGIQAVNNNGGLWNIGSAYSSMDFLMSGRDFPSGTLVTTDINYAVTYGDPFVLEIKGYPYQSAPSFDIQISGYIYYDTIINHGGYSNGTYISGIRAINYNGNLCFWWPYQSYWQGFSIKVYVPYGGRQTNRVTSITNSAQPTTAKQVNFDPVQSLHSGNYNSYAPTLTGGNASGTWSINITGNSNSVGGYVVGNSASQVAYFNGSGNLFVNNPESYVGEVRLGAAWGRGGVYASARLSMATSSGEIDFVSNDNSIGGFRYDNTNGTRFIVGLNSNISTPHTLVDTNKRPIIYARGAYPVLTLDHTETGNTSHGPTIQFVFNGLDARQWLFGASGDGTKLDWGYSNSGLSNTNYNPHNGIAGYQGVTFMTVRNNGRMGFGWEGDWGTYGANSEPLYPFHFIGSNQNSHTYCFRNNVNATGNGSGAIFVNTYGNHSWGIVAEFRIDQASADRPSIMFSQGANNNTWSVGFGSGSDDNFRINRDHGHRNGSWGTTLMNMDRSGNVVYAGDVTAYSDARVKGNVRTIEFALEKVLNMRGVTYNRTDSEDNKKKVGVIAQEVLEVLPEVVNQDSAGMYNVSYGNIVGVLIEAIKEQQKQIEELKSKLN